jgi:SAM-dependent methyltransferase
MNTERLCPICQSHSYLPFADERIEPGRVGALTYASRKTPEFMCLRLVRCTVCDLVYAPSPPDEDFLQSAYSGADFDSGPEAIAAAHTYAKALAPYIGHLAKNSAAVDVGAGSGPLLPWLQQFGFSTVIGIEPSRAAINAADPEVRPLLREGMFSAKLLEDVMPSLVCSFMTLEHLRSPGEFADTAFQLLKPGGAFAVVVHDWRAPLNRLLGLRSPIIDVEHMQLFSPNSLSYLLEKTGFEIKALHAIRNAYSLRYWLRLTPFPSAIKKILLRILEILGLADRQLAFGVGNMLAVGLKPR